MKLQEMFDGFASCLSALATELTSDQITELVEMATLEQNNWIVDGPGWKVLETFKDFVRAE